MALAHCILGSFLGVGCHCFPPSLDVPTFASKCLHVQATWETSISERRNYGREMAGDNFNICKFYVHVSKYNHYLSKMKTKESERFRVYSRRVTQPLGWFGQEPEPSQATDTALACCFLGKVLGVGCHYFPPPLDIPIFAARYLHVHTTREILLARILSGNLAEVTTSTPQITTWDRRLYFPSEGRRNEDFFALRIRRLRPSLDPRTWVPQASTLTPRPPKPLEATVLKLI